MRGNLEASLRSRGKGNQAVCLAFFPGRVDGEENPTKKECWCSDHNQGNGKDRFPEKR